MGIHTHPRLGRQVRLHKLQEGYERLTVFVAIVLRIGIPRGNGQFELVAQNAPDFDEAAFFGRQDLVAERMVRARHGVTKHRKGPVSDVLAFPLAQ